MNIFYLAPDPKTAAQFHLDSHVVKMILESAQLLCTAHRVLDGTITTEPPQGKRTRQKYTHPETNLDAVLYKTTHINHPCAIWVRNSINNYMWLYELFVALCDEYTFRYGKKHKSDTMLRDILKSPPTNIPFDTFTHPPQAMPVEYKHSDVVIAYRQYYMGAKTKMAKWTRRPAPDWFMKGNAYANI